MLAGDNEAEAARMARTIASPRARHFYDPQRRAGTAFVADHFREEAREALAAFPPEHPFHKRLARWAAAQPGENPLWDAVLFFPPGVEWGSTSPPPDWWAKQIGFTGDESHKPTGQFLRNHIQDGPLESDWFDEAREGMKVMRERISRGEK
jgi:hypothetical protein